MIRHTARCQRPISALSMRWAPGGRFHSGSQLTLQLKQPIEVDGPPPRTLVKDLDFKLQAGERWAILGPNGSGKSTIARTLLERWEPCWQKISVSSFLFPDLHPDDPDYDPATSGFRPPRTRVSPLPVPYDADASHPLLEKLETASSSGKAARLLHFFGLWQLRHRPLFALSTGEGRKLLMVDALLKEPSLLILDEAFDGLDKSSRVELASMLESFFDESPRALVMIVHRLEDLVPLPTSVLLLGQGGDGTDHRFSAALVNHVLCRFRDCLDLDPAAGVGPWSQMEARVKSFLQDSSTELPSPDRLVPTVATGEPLVEFKDVTIEYGPVCVFDKLNWTVRESEKWIVLGGNGTGKTTLFDLITGENVLGYTQNLHLFGRQKGSGESIWDIKKQLGVISSELHMEFLIYSDPRFDRKVTAWEVACSGLFDSIGLYAEPTATQIQTVQQWADMLGLQDLVVAPKGEKILSLQQKLVLLCRALVKCPRLLLLDEPTHGLSGENRLLILSALRTESGDSEDDCHGATSGTLTGCTGAGTGGSSGRHALKASGSAGQPPLPRSCPSAPCGMPRRELDPPRDSWSMDYRVSSPKGNPRVASFVRLNNFLLRTHITSLLSALAEDGWLEAWEKERLCSAARESESPWAQSFLRIYARFMETEDVPSFVAALKAQAA
eukprot:s3567_g4.t3